MKETGQAVGPSDTLSDADDEEEDTGVFETELSPGIASIVPKGYKVTPVTPTHPNSNFDRIQQGHNEKNRFLSWGFL